MDVKTSRGALALAAAFALIAATAPAINRYVAAAGTDASPYTNWHTAAHSIQSAVDVSADGDVVWITNGTYVVTSEVTVDKGVTLRSIDVAARPVTLNGGGVNRCLLLNHSAAVIAGLVITNGYNDVAGGGIEMYGGTVSNCLITGNRVDVYSADSFGGGGVDCYLSGQLLNCDIVGNMASGTESPGGGGVLCQGQDVVVRECRIEKNAVVSPSTNGLGGGLLCVDTARVQRCIIRGNTIQGAGGGVFCENQISVSDCAVLGNSATLNGGGLYFRKGGGATNCTVAENTAPAAGTGGLFIDDNNGAQTKITACVICSNQPSNYAWNQVFGGHYIEYSCLWPDSPLFNGPGNITNAPRWRAAGDYRLRPDSPCIDLSSFGEDSDLDALPRPMDGNFDGITMYDAGCYEFSTNQDTDANGLPDGWEYRYFGVFTGTAANVDSDGDAVTNLVEFQQGSHPRDDSSGTPYVNGLPTGWLVKYGLSVTSPDPDGDPDSDGVSNLGEMIAGTQPNNSNSYPAIAMTGIESGKPSALRWPTAPRRTYTVTESTNLVPGMQFSTVQDGLAGPQWPSTNELPLAATTNFHCYRLIITRPYP